MNTKHYFARAYGVWLTRINRVLDCSTEALAFWPLVVWVSIVRWCSYRRWCAWCARPIGGNPFAKRGTSGICRACAETLLRAGETGGSFTANVNPLSPSNGTSSPHPLRPHTDGRVNSPARILSPANPAGIHNNNTTPEET